MLVSVIVPVFNKEQYLNQCIESIVNQTYKSLEIIIINDGSKDNSGNIIHNWLARDPRIQYFYQDNQGVSATRNKGISLAKGNYIFFMDADDYLHQDAIFKLVKNVEEADADIIIANFCYQIDKQTTKNLPLKNRIVKDEALYSTQNKADMFFSNGKPLVSVCNKLYKKKFIEKINIQFEDGVLAEDKLFNLKCYVNQPVLSIINEYTYTCNIIDGSRSRTKKNGFYHEIIILFQLFREYLILIDKVELHFDLMQLVLLKDLERIFDYICNNFSSEKMKQMSATLKLIYKDEILFDVLKESHESKILKKIKGKKNYLFRFQLILRCLITRNAFLFSSFYVSYNSLMKMLKKLK